MTAASLLAFGFHASVPTPPAHVAPTARTRETDDYVLPDGRVVAIDADVARGAATVTFTLVGGSIVVARLAVAR